MKFFLYLGTISLAPLGLLLVMNTLMDLIIPVSLLIVRLGASLED